MHSPIIIYVHNWSTFPQAMTPYTDGSAVRASQPSTQEAVGSTGGGEKGSLHLRSAARTNHCVNPLNPIRLFK